MLLRHSRLLFLSRFVFKFIPNLKHFIRIYPPFWNILSWWISCVYLDESGGVIKIKWYLLSWWNGCVYQDEFLLLSWWIKMLIDLMWCTRLVERNLQFFFTYTKHNSTLSDFFILMYNLKHRKKIWKIIRGNVIKWKICIKNQLFLD